MCSKTNTFENGIKGIQINNNIVRYYSMLLIFTQMRGAPGQMITGFPYDKNYASEIS